MLEKETKFLFNYSPCDNDETVTYESRKRDTNNSFQFDRIIKLIKPSSPTVPKLLNGTAYFSKRVTLSSFILILEQGIIALNPTFPP